MKIVKLPRCRLHQIRGAHPVAAQVSWHTLHGTAERTNNFMDP
jgi:hypothetical protein